MNLLPPAFLLLPFCLGVFTLIICAVQLWRGRRERLRLRTGCHLGTRVLLSPPATGRLHLPNPKARSFGRINQGACLDALLAVLACLCLGAVMVACCMDAPADVDAAASELVQFFTSF